MHKAMLLMLNAIMVDNDTKIKHIIFFIYIF